MARTRLIKPEFFKHGDLYDAEARTGLPLRLAFAGLWCIADKAGRFAWKPREMKLDVLPYDDCDFGRVLDALAAAGFIVRYVVDGKAYGFIPSWPKHQTTHKTERASSLPAPTDNGGLTVMEPLSHGESTVPVPLDTVTVTGTDAVTGKQQQPSAAAATEPEAGAAVPTLVAPVPASAGAAARRADRPGRPKADRPATPKYPHYPQSACDTLYAIWTERRGPYDYGRFRKETAGLFDRDPPRFALDDLCGAMRLAIAVVKHRYKTGQNRVEWSVLKPQAFAERAVQWVEDYQRTQVEPDHADTLFSMPAGRGAA